MTAIWPGSLPQCPLADFEETAVGNRVSFQSDTGPSIERPKGTMKMSELRATLRMTSEQVQTFEDFFQNDIAQGTSSFFWKHPRKGEQVKVRITGDRPYSIARLGAGTWTVAFLLLVIG